MISSNNDYLNILKHKFYEYSDLKNSIFEFVLKKDKDTSAYHIYYGRIILTNRELDSKEQLREEDEDVILFRVFGTRENALCFLYVAEEKEEGYIGIDTKNIDKFDIILNFDEINKYLIPFQRKKEYNLTNPTEGFILHTKDKQSYQRLQKFEDIDSMIYNFFKTNLSKDNGLRNTLSFYFEKEDGKIFDVSKIHSGLGWKIDFNEHEQEKYQVILLNKDIRPAISERIAVKKECFYPKNINHFEIRLLKDHIIIDQYFSIDKNVKEKIKANNNSIHQQNIQKTDEDSPKQWLCNKIPPWVRKHKKSTIIAITVVVLFMLLNGFNIIMEAWQNILIVVPISTNIIIEPNYYPKTSGNQYYIPVNITSNKKLTEVCIFYKIGSANKFEKAELENSTVYPNTPQTAKLKAEINPNCDPTVKAEIKLFIDENNNYYGLNNAKNKNICLYKEIKIKLISNEKNKDTNFYYPYFTTDTTLIKGFFPEIPENANYKEIQTEAELPNTAKSLFLVNLLTVDTATACETGKLDLEWCEKNYFNKKHTN